MDQSAAMIIPKLRKGKTVYRKEGVSLKANA